MQRTPPGLMPNLGKRSDMGKRTCSIEGCEHPQHARRYCTMHYQRWQTHGDPLKVVTPTRSICSVRTCAELARAEGLCNGHYKRKRETGDVKADVPLRKIRRGRTEKCNREGCEETYLAKGLCKKHYMEARVARLAAEPCIIDGCDRPRGTVEGYCFRHYQRDLKHGDPFAGGELRRLRGTGNRWEYDQNRRNAKAKMSQVSGETAGYVKIIRLDPCVYCGAPCEHIDHIVPFADGGATDWTNLAPACAACNYRKSRRSLLAFMLDRVTEDREALAA